MYIGTLYPEEDLFSSLNLEQMGLSQHRIMPLAVFNYEINSP